MKTTSRRDGWIPATIGNLPEKTMPVFFVIYEGNEPVLKIGGFLSKNMRFLGGKGETYSPFKGGVRKCVYFWRPIVYPKMPRIVLRNQKDDPVCHDSRECAFRDKSGCCLALHTTYEDDGMCEFCKTKEMAQFEDWLFEDDTEGEI